jgi:VWFA-related protein
MKCLSFLLAVLIGLSFSTATFAQTPKPTPPPVEDENDTVKISTNLIQLDVTVTDKDDNIVTDLKPGDIEVFENGKKQEIANFAFINQGGNDNLSVEAGKPPKINGKVNVPTPSFKLKAEQVRRTYALVVDDLGLSFASIFFVKEALKRFINNQMEAGDLVAIIQTGRTNGSLSGFTSDKAQLLRVVDKLKWNFMGRSGISSYMVIDNAKGLNGLQGGLPSAGANPYDPKTENLVEERRSNNLIVGTFVSANQVIKKMQELPGRKAVLLFSEGFSLNNLYDVSDDSAIVKPNQALDSMKQLIDLANRASVVIYTIDPRGLQNVQMFSADENPGRSGSFNQNADRQRDNRGIKLLESQQSLRILAEETGGLAFINQNNIDKGLRRAVNDQSGYYLLGYVPDDDTFDPDKNKFNKLEVKAIRLGLKIRYRSGFFGIDDKKYFQARKSSENNLASALSSPFTANGVGVELTSIFADDVKQGSVVRALLNIDAKDLTFTDAPNGGKQTEFGLYAFIFGENGRILNTQNRIYRIKVSPGDYQNMVNKGFIYSMDVPFKKSGAYQLRIAVQDTQTKKIGSANQYIEVPDLGKNKLTLSGLILQTYTNDEWQKISTAANLAGSSPEAISITGKAAQTAQMTTAVRKLKQGSVMQFSYAVYNAKNAEGKAFKSQTRLFRDGQLVFEGKQLPLALKVEDAKRAQGEGAVALGRELPPGDYVLQVVVFDENARDKAQVAAQSIDFEIIN